MKTTKTRKKDIRCSLCFKPWHGQSPCAENPAPQPTQNPDLKALDRLKGCLVDASSLVTGSMATEENLKYAKILLERALQEYLPAIAKALQGDAQNPTCARCHKRPATDLTGSYCDPCDESLSAGEAASWGKFQGSNY